MLADRSVDLFAVAQAWHWFNREAYLAEARRVAVPGAVLAVWTYNLHRVTEEVDSVVDALYAELDPWWPAERRHVVDGYAHLAPPGDEVLQRERQGEDRLRVSPAAQRAVDDPACGNRRE